jgi:hypothetical protein
MDLTDSRLFDFFQKHGLIEAGDDTSYSREYVLGLVRAAFIEGSDQQARDPHGMDATRNAISDLVVRQRDQQGPKASTS